MVELFCDKEDFGIKINELEILLGKSIRLIKKDTSWVINELEKHYKISDINYTNKIGNNPLILFNNNLIYLVLESKSLNSSDIHIESYENYCRIRFRIDGKLVERHLINKKDYPSLINKIKIKANLDISEKRLPQDGRIFINEGNHKFDIRVSILPTLYGEKVVLRLLSNSTAEIDLYNLGFSKQQLDDYLEAIKKPHGIVLITGPTGSGKTTTLYATLKILNQKKSNILTIEDPIEYTLEGVNQVQLKENIGLTFANALRTFLRQDPDIIMLGEIRDGETAQMAIRAALTGHLVFSTIHTNSAWGAVSRLVDMGVPSFLIANTLNATIAQRLIRVLCENCKEILELKKELYPRNFQPPKGIDRHYVARGCDDCLNTGYKGRKAIYEVILIDHKLVEAIKSNNNSINEYVDERNISTLSNEAFEMFASGRTSLEEIYPILLNAAI
jgi:general secretion pathway protein E/type IV pilus assembly protein PilB